MQTTPPDGTAYFFLSMDKPGDTARVHWRYTFPNEDLHPIADLYLFASFVIRQRVNLIGNRGNHAAALDDALKLENLPDLATRAPWIFQWEAPSRRLATKSGKVHLEPERDAMRKAKRMFVSVHTIAPLDDDYLSDLRRSPLGPYIGALTQLPRAICMVNLEASKFGLMNRDVAKYAAPAVSHLWATLVSTNDENETFYSVLLDVAEMCRVIELDPDTAPILQPFFTGLVVDECLERELRRQS